MKTAHTFHMSYCGNTKVTLSSFDNSTAIILSRKKKKIKLNMVRDLWSTLYIPGRYMYLQYMKLNATEVWKTVENQLKNAG
jgi:hypothetical protein